MGDGGSGCCNEPQVAFLALFAIYLILVFLTWRSELSKPLRLIAVFLHEISHAIACWITCGDVHNIEVYHNEGGVTRYVGGCRVLIIPAGYVGCSLWGMVFVVLSGGRKTATGAAITFVVALLVSLCYSPNRLMVGLNLGYALLTIIFIVVEWYVFNPVLTYLILFYGVFVGTYSIFDIYADLCKRTVMGSDAYACYEICPCCLPRCVGIQWCLVAIFTQIFGVWLAVVLMSDDCEDESWMGCIRSKGPFALDFDWDMPDLFDFGKWSGP